MLAARLLPWSYVICYYRHVLALIKNVSISYPVHATYVKLV